MFKTIRIILQMITFLILTVNASLVGEYISSYGNSSLIDCCYFYSYSILVNDIDGKSFKISVDKTFSPPGKELKIHSVGKIKNNQIIFSFEDNWQNKGEGYFYKNAAGTYSLVLEFTNKDSIFGADISALYGECKLLKKSPDTENYYNELGEKYYKEKMYHKAQEVFAILSSTYPGNERAQGNFIIASIKTANYSAAESNAHQLVENTQSNKVKASSYFNIGLSKELQSQLDSAVIYYEKSLLLKDSEFVSNKINELKLKIKNDDKSDSNNFNWKYGIKKNIKSMLKLIF